MHHDALLIGGSILVGVFLTAVGTYAFLRWLFALEPGA